MDRDTRAPLSAASLSSLGLVVGGLGFVLGAFGIGVAQGIPRLRPRLDATAYWELQRAWPWLLMAFLAPLLHAVASEILRRRTPRITSGGGPYRHVELPGQPIVEARGRRRAFHLALALIAVSMGVLEARRWSSPIELPSSCRKTPVRIEVVALGTVGSRVVQRAVQHLAAVSGLPVVAGTPRELPSGAYDRKRQQYDGELVLASLGACAKHDPLCESTLLIGITEWDVFSSEHEWRYALTLRELDRNVAIVSTARLSASGFGSREDRLDKLLSRTLAFKVCGLPPSSDPRSVLYAGINSPRDLDRMDESRW